MTTPSSAREAAVEQDRYAEWKGWDAARFGQPTRGDSRYFAWHVKRCKLRAAAPANPLHVLEFGYGNGAFLGWARQHGFQASGVEAQPLLIQRARDAGWPAAEQLAELDHPSAGYDLIVAFDVLEHVPAEAWSPFMSQMTEHLAPAGRVLLRMPNGDSPFGRANQHGDLTHVGTFGLNMLRQLCAMHGLEVAARGEAPWHCLQGMSRTPTNALRAAARSLLETWIRFAYAWSALSLSPNLVVVLQRRSAAAPER